MSYENAKKKETFEIAEWLGYEPYVGSGTYTLYARIDGVQFRFEPYQHIEDAFIAVDKVISRGYEVYIFFKQPNEANAMFGSKNLNWVCEIRNMVDGKYKMLFRVSGKDKCSTISLAIHSLAMKEQGWL
jgi:hypothetical protein